MTIMTQPKLTYKRGDVVLVLFPHSNLKTAKVRPAIVIQADNLQTGLPQLIVAMITSRMFRANHPSRVTIQLASSEGQQSGLLTDSVVMKVLANPKAVSQPARRSSKRWAAQP